VPMRNIEGAVAKLTGEVHALFIITQVLARSHPNPDALLSDLDTFEQNGLANLEQHSIPDDVLVGYQHALAGIRKAINDKKQG
jgi:hypothetical protein